MTFDIKCHRFWNQLYEGTPYQSLTRHNKTQVMIKNTIAKMIKYHARQGHALLEIGGSRGYQTIIYSEQLDKPELVMIYDWQDYRGNEVKELCGFKKVDLEVETFPEEDETYDVVVCNQVFEHLKNIFTPLSETWRVLKPGGYLILSVPNLSAFHNCCLLWLGRQPTTIAIHGGHVRGYAIQSMTQFCLHNNHFKLVELKGVGLHPFTSQVLPGFMRTYCHTPVWVLQKQPSTKPLWDRERLDQFTTTKFFEAQEGTPHPLV